jgi:hypothetical protein
VGANGDCMKVSKPYMANDLFWQNHSFSVDIVSAGSGLQSQQNLIGLTPLLTQGKTGACSAVPVTGTLPTTFYWDIGLRTDDVASSAIPAGTKLALTNSILTKDTQGVITSLATDKQPAASPVIEQFCNGARMPPEHCADEGIDKNSAACKGFNAPPGASESTGTTQLFVFNGIQPTATVDEGHNWLNLSYGPLTLSRTHLATPTSAPELMVSSGDVGVVGGAYSISSVSPAVNGGSNTTANGIPAVPSTDYFGNPRALTNGNKADIGAVEFQVPNVAVPVVTPTALAFGSVVTSTTSAAQTLTLSNNGGAPFTGITVTVTAPFSRTGTGGTNCGTTLNAGATCTINVVFSPTAVVASTGTVTITGSAAVVNSPVSLSGTGVAPVRSASVSSGAFGNFLTGTTSGPLFLTVTNTGNVGLAGGTFALGGGTPQPFTRLTTGTFPATAPNCAATLAVGAACSIKLQFAAPATPTSFSRTLTVAYTGATVTPTPVPLTASSVTTRGTVSITPNPLTITLPSGVLNVTGTGTVTLTNTQAASGTNVTVTSVAASGGTGVTYFFNLVASADTCSGTNLAPGASCTVGVRFTNVTSARGPNRAGTITFTDTAAGTPTNGVQTGALIGIATP